MKIGFISDTHNSIFKVKKAISIFKEENVEKIIHLGDVTSKEIVDLFSEFNTIFVQGNCDHVEIFDYIKSKNMISTKFHQENIDSKKIGCIHGDDEIMCDNLIHSKLYDYFFFGHIHKKTDVMINNTRVLNPGGFIRCDPYDTNVLIVDFKNDKVTFYNV